MVYARSALSVPMLVGRQSSISRAVLLCGCWALAFGGCVESSGSVSNFNGVGPSAARPQFAPGDDKSYFRIGATDVLKVTVFQVDELNRTVQVSGRGTVTLPLIGEVKAAGRTAQEVEADVAARLKAKYLNSPQVTIFIEEYNSQKITVSGSVRRPGVFPVKGQITLMQAIAAAEGLDNVADASNVTVMRQGNEGRVVEKFDVEQIRTGAANDPMLESGDVVIVDNSGPKTVLRDWSPALGGVSSAAALASVVK